MLKNPWKLTCRQQICSYISKVCTYVYTCNRAYIANIAATIFCGIFRNCLEGGHIGSHRWRRVSASHSKGIFQDIGEAEGSHGSMRPLSPSTPHPQLIYETILNVLNLCCCQCQPAQYIFIHPYFSFYFS